MDAPKNNEQDPNDNTEINMKRLAAEETITTRKAATSLEAGELAVSPSLLPTETVYYRMPLTVEPLLARPNQERLYVLESFERDRGRIHNLRSQRGSIRSQPPLQPAPPPRAPPPPPPPNNIKFN